MTYHFILRKEKQKDLDGQHELDRYLHGRNIVASADDVFKNILLLMQLYTCHNCHVVILLSLSMFKTRIL